MRPVSIDSEAGSRAYGTFSGQVTVVVGGGSGLGRAVAKAFGRQGASVVVADFDGPRMDRTVDEIMRLGTSEAAIAIPTDVRSDASVRSLARDSIKAMGRADVLVNAAGVLLQGKLEQISGADWTWMLETNLVGPVRTSSALLPHMLGRGSGHIVNVVSYGAPIGSLGLRPPAMPRLRSSPSAWRNRCGALCHGLDLLPRLTGPSDRTEHQIARCRPPVQGP